MGKPGELPQAITFQADSKKLARAIFRAELPEEYVRALPAQSVYMALKSIGLESAQELLEIVTRSQYSTMIDLEFWEGDRINEENIWSWLAAIDEDESFEPLKRFLSSLDLKIVSLLIARHVDTEVFEDQTDNPPGPGFYTPDKGFTWIQIRLSDPDRHRLLGKLLALLFETNVKLFYQLLSIPKVSSASELEEESYQDRWRRLTDEGIPEIEQAIKINSAIGTDQIKAELSRGSKTERVVVSPVIEPLIVDTEEVQPLTDTILKIAGRGGDELQTLQSELSLLMNAGIVAYSIPFYLESEVKLMAEKVRGLINLGLERSQELSGLDPLEIYGTLGLEKLYRLGLDEVRGLKKFAASIPKELLDARADNQPLAVALSGCAADIPAIPNFIGEDGTILHDDSGRLPTGFRAINHLHTIAALKRYVERELKLQ